RPGGRDPLLLPTEFEMMRGMLDVASVTSTICDLYGIPGPADCVARPVGGGMRAVASVASTTCDLYGIPRPADCVAPPFSEVAAFAARRTVTKALVFAADAIGAHLVRSYAEASQTVD